jgi:hypothetical protein
MLKNISPPGVTPVSTTCVFFKPFLLFRIIPLGQEVSLKD